METHDDHSAAVLSGGSASCVRFARRQQDVHSSSVTVEAAVVPRTLHGHGVLNELCVPRRRFALRREASDDESDQLRRQLRQLVPGLDVEGPVGHERLQLRYNKNCASLPRFHQGHHSRRRRRRKLPGRKVCRMFGLSHRAVSMADAGGTRCRTLSSATDRCSLGPLRHREVSRRDFKCFLGLSETSTD